MPKVIDFGLAKAMHQSLTDLSMVTAQGMLLGTPLYMSPEQAEQSNLDIDTRADIYSLGVILYELLVGSTPLERATIKEAAGNEVLRLIKEVEPPRPSTRLSSSEALPSIAAQRSIDPNQLRKSLTGDLDWVVMKALEKERSRRYETANGLAMDIHRYLANEPVSTSPPSARYRLQKFVQRNRIGVYAGLALGMSLLLGLVGTSIGMKWAWQERANAVAAGLLEADAKQTALASAQQARDEASRAERQTAEAIVQRDRAETREKEAINAIRSFGDSVANNPELKNNPSLESLRKTLLKEPLAFLKSMRERLQSDRDTRPESLQQLAAVAFSLGELTDEIGNKQDALTAYREALEIQERLVADNPSVTEYQSDLAKSLNNIGELLSVTGKSEDALAAFERAREIRERLVADNPTVTRFQSDLGANLNNIATIEIRLKKYSEARDHLILAIQHQKQALTISPSDPTYRQFLRNHYTNLVKAASGLQDEQLAKQANRGLLELSASDPKIISLEKRMAEVVAGSESNGAVELLAFASRCSDTERFAMSVRFYELTFQGQPNIVDDRNTQHQYNAACCASLATANPLSSDPPLNDSDTTRLREQARLWLRAELDAWKSLMDAATQPDRAKIASTLAHWQQDSDLAAIRSRWTNSPNPSDKPGKHFGNKSQMLTSEPRSRSTSTIFLSTSSILHIFF